MSKIFLPVSLIALAVLAACASSDPVTPAPAPVVVVSPPVVTAPAPGTVVVPPVAAAPVVVPTPVIRPGFGRIESITALPATAAAGGTAKPLRRFGIKMEDGTVQYVDTAAEGLSIGQRVELTNDGQIRH